MLSRCLAILLLVLLAIVPAAGEAVAFSAPRHCAPVGHTMVMEHASVESSHDCSHDTNHSKAPCTMMGLCVMTGCMAMTAATELDAVAASQQISFRSPDPLRIDGLALSPPLEPPRA